MSKTVQPCQIKHSNSQLLRSCLGLIEAKKGIWEHPDAATIIAGDENYLDDGRILAIDPSLVLILRRPTRKEKIIYIVITVLRRFFIEPRIIDPVPVDDGQPGVPSDHKGVLVLPLGTQEATRGTHKEIKYVRPMPMSAILDYRKSITSVD